MTIKTVTVYVFVVVAGYLTSVPLFCWLLIYFAPDLSHSLKVFVVVHPSVPKQYVICNEIAWNALPLAKCLLKFFSQSIFSSKSRNWVYIFRFVLCFFCVSWAVVFSFCSHYALILGTIFLLLIAVCKFSFLWTMENYPHANNGLFLSHFINTEFIFCSVAYPLCRT